MNSGDFQRDKFRIGQPKRKFFTLEGKTIWDLLQLLVIPLAIAVIAAGLAYFFNLAENKRTESVEATRLYEQRTVEANRIIEQRSIESTRIAEDRKLELDRTRQNIFDNYINYLTTLMLEKELRTSADDSEVRLMAGASTLSAFRSLDEDRKVMLLKFLYESRLIGYWSDEGHQFIEGVISLKDFDLSHIDLRVADFVGIDLSYTNLNSVDLSYAQLNIARLLGAYLTNANLSHSRMYMISLDSAICMNAILNKTDLRDASLNEADLRGADLRHSDISYAKFHHADLSDAILIGSNLENAYLLGAILTGADLSETCLVDAGVIQEQLDEAKSLDKAVLPDGELNNCAPLVPHNW